MAVAVAVAVFIEAKGKGRAQLIGSFSLCVPRYNICEKRRHSQQPAKPAGGGSARDMQSPMILVVRSVLKCWMDPREPFLWKIGLRSTTG